MMSCSPRSPTINTCQMAQVSPFLQAYFHHARELDANKSGQSITRHLTSTIHGGNGARGVPEVLKEGFAGGG